MPNLYHSERFLKELKKLLKKGVLNLAQVEKFLQLLEENPQHPSLRTKKIQGTERIFEASLNMAVRITFEYVKPDTIYLRNVGEHDKTLKRN
jgi:mRNA-degrading endonuclease YafQ of YafQ-DinJ toxin-antitoxin module